MEHGMNKNVMTGPKGKSEFCLSETLNVTYENSRNALFNYPVFQLLHLNYKIAQARSTSG